jgi:predicted Rossmann fold nucleotide-binding protein DprA/Smf involved in DNA uptake
LEQGAFMAGLTIDVSDTSAAAIAATLRMECDRLKAELRKAERALDQVEKLIGLPTPEQTESGRMKHGETEKAVLATMERMSPYTISQQSIMEAIGSSHTTTYRVLKRLESEQVIRQMPGGNWILTNPPVELRQ